MKKSSFYRILDFIDEGIVIFGADWKLLYSNQAFLRITGYCFSDAPDALQIMMQIPGADPATIMAIDRALRSGTAFSGEVLSRGKAGNLFWNDFSFKPEFNEDGSVNYFIGRCRDNSERKAIESKAHKLEWDYRFIFENIQSAITVHGPDAQIRIANPKAIELLGIGEDRLVGSDPDDPQFKLFREDGSDMPLAEYPVFRAILERSSIRGVVMGYHRDQDGKLLWFVCNAFPVLDSTGEPSEVVLSFSDITQLVESEAEARTFRERFELAARATQDVIFEWDIKTGQFWANDSYKTVYGHEPPSHVAFENIGRMSGVEADHDKVREATLIAINSGQERYAIDYDILRADGSRGHVAVRAFIVRDLNGVALKIIGTATDVGQLSLATLALERSETRFRLIADSCSDVLWDHDFDTNDTWSSSDWPTKLGIDVDASQAREFKWVAIVDPADRERLIESFQDAIKSHANAWEIEFKASRADGQTIDLAVKAAILRHPDGRAARILGNMRNITQEKRNQEGYTRARALEAVGQLTGGFAHDFNNLLMIILGNAELLETSELSEDGAESVALINQAAQKAAKITRRLLTFARQNKLHTTRVNVEALISGAMTLLRSGLPETINLRQEIAADVWDAEVDANGIEQALVNLAMNSKDAMPSGGEIFVKCDNCEFDANMIPPVADLRPGRYVMVSLRDNGEGMEAHVLSRAFEPFFTTKDVGKGTGLGLSTVFGFVSQSGGGVSLSSEPGCGTTVTLYLPAAGDGVRVSDAVESKAQSGPSDPPVRILVAEDQAEVRRYVERSLARLGHTVVTVKDAASALALLRQGQEFDLLYTDIVMPGEMNGQQLAELAQRLFPRIKVLYTSGYPAAAFEHLGLKQQNGVNLLRKPYRIAELKEAIQHVLSDR